MGSYTVSSRLCCSRLALSAVAVLLAVSAARAASVANIDVVQHDAGNATTSVTVTIPAGQSAGDFLIRDGSNRGDYNVQIGSSPSTNFANGVLISSIRQNGRNNYAYGDATNATVYAATTVDADGNGMFTSVFTVGSSAGAEFNTNLAAAYFPFSEGWMAGHAKNSTNNGPLTSITGTSYTGLTIGTNLTDSTSTTGEYRLSIPNADSRTDGVLLVVGGKNEGNFALSKANTDGSWQIYCKDSGADVADGYENDPVAFAFVPVGTKGVTMGRLMSGGGPGAVVSQGDFTVQRVADGRYLLKIAGQSPTTGSLIVSAEGGANANVDNLVTYQASGTGWEIQTRDIPGMGLQALTDEPLCNFVFVPFNNAPTAPGTPSALDPTRVAAGNFKVTEFNGTNNADGMFALRTEGNRALGVFNSNRGDVQLSYQGRALAAGDGVVLGSIIELKRNNSATGGLNDYGTITVDTQAHTFQASGAAGEFNVNYAVALFPASAGFQMAANVSAASGLKSLTLGGTGDTLKSGLLMVTAYGNVSNFASTSATGTGWDVNVRDNDSSAVTGGFNYAYIPWGTEGLVAGSVQAGGHVQNRAGQFTISREGTGLYRLSIPGKSASDGMLLLTATTADSSGDNTLCYRADGSDFLIQGLDHGSGAPGAQDTTFNFVYVDFNDPLHNPAQRDLQPTRIQAGNVRIIQNDTGNSSTSVSTRVTQGTELFCIGAANRGDFNPYVNGVNVMAADGIMLATVRNNGRDNNEGKGTVYAIAGVGSNSGGAWVAVDRAMGGPIGAGDETNVDLAVALFPFAGGFTGAHVDGAGTPLISTLPAGSVISHTGTGRYTLTIPGVNSRRDGLLFSISGENTDNATAASVLPSGAGWDIGSFDNQATLGQYQDVGFSLLYLPMYATQDIPAMGLIAADGTAIAGSGMFDIQHMGTGQYLLTLPELSANGGLLTPDEGVLLLSLAGLNNGMPANDILSYEATADGRFLIQVRELPGDVPALADMDFAFAYVRFDTTLALDIPEPCTMTLLAVGLAAAGWRTRRLGVGRRSG